MNGRLVRLIVVLGLIETAFGCNGYKAIIRKIENCAGADAVITIDEGFTVEFSKKCELVPSGCVSNKAFTTANAEYTIKKNGVILKQEKINICEAAEEVDQEAKSFMKVFSIPESCPVPAEKVCANDHRFDLSNYKNLLPLAKGSFELQANIEHDTGKSCFNIEMEIRKGRK